MKKHKLSNPVTLNGQTVSEVTVSNIKVKHLKAVEKAREEGGDFNAAIAVVAGLTGLSAELVEEMDATDFATLSEMAESFLPPKSAKSGES
jgi:Phage tail assembly chaperone proteins, E, or 41 or 14